MNDKISRIKPRTIFDTMLFI